MFSPRSRAMARAAHQATYALADHQPDHPRALSQLTMGFENIAKWKAEKRKRTNPNYQNEHKTVFDIHIGHPSHKSNAWNISYEPDETTPKPNTVAPTPHLTPSTRKGQTRSFHASPSPIPSSAASRAHAEAHPLTQTQPVTLTTPSDDTPTHTDPVFGGKCTSAEILDVPSPEILGRLCTSNSITLEELPSPVVILDQVISKNPPSLGLLQRVAQLLALLGRSSGGNTGTPQEASVGLPLDVPKPEAKAEDNEGRIEVPEVEEDQHPVIRRELPMFLGGGPF
ncbi:hypothetical protein B0T16DRAFT_51173 [Cercophora newfieldiana]|uniref:Uncharacterized protein n=1 Tax=Cercophora newfieldiana TaxID=92897 RepID=A0AA39YR16_9PEZI|nr:hypothetical protein B0T16DRAFT_51173 [Cercophora newfieldiana]